MVLNKLKVRFSNFNEAQVIVGQNDSFIKIIERLFGCDITTRGEDILVSSEDEKILKQIESVFSALKDVHAKDISITDRDVTYLSNMAKENKIAKAVSIYSKRVPIVRTHRGKTLYAKSLQQINYLKSIDKNDLVFVTGPAGTGKTYVAVLYGLEKLKNNEISKIILTRPAVEAGESLGFLPGDLKEKVDPYLQPLYDALYDVLGKETVEGMLEKGVIEIAPLAYMRGRTLDNAYIILDEAQNTTEKQMKMFLTRLGHNSKMIVTGDTTQIDLPGKSKSGLIVSAHILKDIQGIGLINFSKIDVIRHPLVQEIIRKYEEYENDRN